MFNYFEVLRGQGARRTCRFDEVLARIHRMWKQLGF
jgi:hypothetical protein